MFGDSLFDEDRSLYPKDRTTTQFKSSKILITVKSIPQPSATYGDTVCVAGIQIDNDQMKWVRLYPIPFRSMDELDQFTKYEIIELPVLPNQSDFRPESYKPNRSSIIRHGLVEGWQKRNKYVAPLTDRWNMCEILAKARSGSGPDTYPSLAVVRPRKILDFTVSPFKGWTDEQIANVERAFTQDDLFSLDKKPKTKLEEPRFEAKFHYVCMSKSCNGHSQSFIDWELEGLSRRLRDKSTSEAAAMIRDKFLTVMCNPKAVPLFFVGNLKAKTLAYNVLGIYRSNGT